MKVSVGKLLDLKWPVVQRLYDMGDLTLSPYAAEKDDSVLQMPRVGSGIKIGDVLCLQEILGPNPNRFTFHVTGYRSENPLGDEKDAYKYSGVATLEIETPEEGATQPKPLQMTKQDIDNLAHFLVCSYLHFLRKEKGRN